MEIINGTILFIMIKLSDIRAAIRKKLELGLVKT